MDSFNPYFESRNNKPEPKKEEKPADKKPAPAKKQEKPAAKKDTAPKAPQKAAAEAAKPAQPVQTAKPAAPKAEPKAEKPVEKKPEAPKNNNNNNEKMPLHKSEQKSALERFNNQVKKSDEKKNSAVKQEPKKPENKIADNNKTVKTKLGGNFSSESVKVEQKMRTVDTRGSYVDIDKYNESTRISHLFPAAEAESAARTIYPRSRSSHRSLLRETSSSIPARRRPRLRSSADWSLSVQESSSSKFSFPTRSLFPSLLPD